MKYTIAIISTLLGMNDGMLANPKPYVLKLDGGCEMKVRPVGNAFSAYVVNEDEYSLCSKEGSFYYVSPDGLCNGPKVSCGGVSGENSFNSAKFGVPEGIVPKTTLKPAISIEDQEYGEEENSFVEKHRRRVLQSGGSETINNLVLMVRFADHRNDPLPSKSEYEFLFNGEGTTPSVPTGSIKSFYKTNSLGKLTINSVLSGWITVSHTEAEAAGPDGCNGSCGRGETLREDIVEALFEFERQIGGNAFNQLFDLDNDGVVDMFTVIHSGRGAESVGKEGISSQWIWSHKYVLSRGYVRAPISRLAFQKYNVNPGIWHEREFEELKYDITHFGVVAHEMGHFLGLPDLYDRDYSSYGLGGYCMMANSWGKDGTQFYPPSFSPPMKEKLGWVSYQPLARRNVLAPYQSTNAVVKLPLSSDGAEYILIENRQPLETDSLLKGGILIYQIDRRIGSQNDNEFQLEDKTTWRNSHPYSRVIQADQLFQLEKSREEGGNSGNDPDFWGYSDCQFLGDALSSSSPELPNINTYSKLGQKSGHLLFNFKALPSGEVEFEYINTFNTPAPYLPTCSPTPKPTTSVPTPSEDTEPPAPTKEPTPSPTKFPTPTPPPTNLPTSKPCSGFWCGWGSSETSEQVDEDGEQINSSKSYGPFIIGGVGTLIGVVAIVAGVVVVRRKRAAKAETKIEEGVVVVSKESLDEML